MNRIEKQHRVINRMAKGLRPLGLGRPNKRIRKKIAKRESNG